MQQTLFIIPHELGGLPVFGWGWMLILWGIYGGVWLTRYYTAAKNPDASHPFIPIVAVAALIAFVLPFVEPTDTEGVATGLQIRGYGVMVLLGVLSGMGLLTFLARQQKLPEDFAMSLMLYLFIPGLFGGRTWYVIQKWTEFATFDLQGNVVWKMTLPRIVKFTEGGLVVYGALIGSMLGCLFYISLRKLPKLATLDIIVPALMVGMFFGRIGCFMNGCCYGGICDANPLGVTFPAGSPPYMRHVDDGLMFDVPLQDKMGLTADVAPRLKGQWALTVIAVEPSGVAANAGVAVGQSLLINQKHIDGAWIEYIHDDLFSEDMFWLRNAESRALIGTITVGDMPRRSLSIYPAQLLSSMTGGIICVILLGFYQIRKRDGQVVALFLTLYSSTRFLLELVRNDELGQLNTGLTISQIGSLIALLIAALLWWHTSRGKHNLAYPLPPSDET
jgi:phosphatidylglycerol---prolipoprotein diacylglyceryl transferase